MSSLSFFCVLWSLPGSLSCVLWPGVCASLVLILRPVKLAAEGKFYGRSSIMTNAIELIKADHRKVEHLYQHYQGANGQTQPKQSILQEICQELQIHAKLEEEIFYPAVERKLGREGAHLVQAARKEHNDIKDAISQLQASGFASSKCDPIFRDMMKDVQHHVKEEETEMLPQAEQQLGAEIERLGAQMQQQKQELHNTTSGLGSQKGEARLNE
jgi:hemerythrin superfamily protein